jgi:hypothetical protein
MKQHIKDANLARSSILAQSKDKSFTGDGIPISISLPFIKKVAVPEPMVNHHKFKWNGCTDREAGMWGEEIVDWCMGLGFLSFPAWRADKIRDRKRQIHDGDFQLLLFCPHSGKPFPTVEVKTELKKTGNIYVQTKEGVGAEAHKPQLYKTADGSLAFRKTALE